MKDNVAMNIRIATKLVVLGSLIVTAFYLLHGHDVLTGIALSLLFLIVVAKVVFAIIARRGGAPPSGGGGYGPPHAPVPRPPGGRPPALSAAAEVKSF